MKALFQRLYRIKAENPSMTLADWQRDQPVAVLHPGGWQLVISQPMSSFWVGFLGIQTIIAGCMFWPVSVWWAVSLWLWGIGALLAGASYQAFGYHFKVAGRDQAVWTNWWEVIYQLCQQWSVNAMLAGAVLATDPDISGVVDVAIWLSAIYAAFWIVGALLPVKRFISFEFMCLVSLPVYLWLTWFHGMAYTSDGGTLDRAMLITWTTLFLSMAAYYAWYGLGLTQKIWRRGWWFSDNDVLHVTLIAWMFYIMFGLRPLMT